ncbi:MAG TPA: deoxyribodipyrimidine photo-lyase [Bryobacteraceae bacterium]|nr:deoxyribodipyrimidine photo-lyase [Bryobacteraceae bacterium]
MKRGSGACSRTLAGARPPAPVLVWFRDDLRLADNLALAAAFSTGRPMIPVFIWAPEEEGNWRPGAASNWWLDASLRALSRELDERGSRLIIRRGPTATALATLLEQTKASGLFWNRVYHPSTIQRDSRLKSEIRARGVAVETLNGSLLFEPSTILNSSGKPFAVFTPFWRACLAKAVSAPLDPPPHFPAPEAWVDSLPVCDLGLQPAIDWASGFRNTWQPGEKGAKAQLDRFRQAALDRYGASRDRPGIASTSRLSPHLRFGEISARQIWQAVDGLAGADDFLRQLGWREFSYHVLYSHPESVEQPLRPEFARFPWRHDPRSFAAWTRGTTGYPFVDAGMRELWRTGWMHNRVRMVAASFLVKHLLIAWQEGAAWFWDTLLDADRANNTMGWQWVAGCGADAAPYFRIFNPVLQGEKFDPAGNYVRRWIPELAELPDRWIHKPWLAPGPILARAGIELGTTYPHPIVNHDDARRRALAALRKTLR